MTRIANDFLPAAHQSPVAEPVLHALGTSITPGICAGAGP